MFFKGPEEKKFPLFSAAKLMETKMFFFRNWLCSDSISTPENSA
jgi:hypothetical protein